MRFAGRVLSRNAPKILSTNKYILSVAYCRIYGNHKARNPYRKLFVLKDLHVRFSTRHEMVCPVNRQRLNMRRWL